MSKPKVVAVILNMDRKDDTLACLRSLISSDYPNLEIIVLDISSSDGSVQAIHDHFGNVKIVNLEQNKGYAGNNNMGILIAMEMGADWIFIANEDTIINPPGISFLVEAGESNPGIGMVGPVVYHFDEPEIIQSAGGILDGRWRPVHLEQNQLDLGQVSELKDVHWISGCAILVRRQVVEQVGSLDERFFCYWEEVDWAYRVGTAGWRIVIEPRAKLWHKGVRRDYQPSPSVTYYSTRNQLLFLSKHHAPL